MTNQELLAKQIGKLPPEEVYDLLYHIIVVIGSRYNTSRGGIADWLTQDAVIKCVDCTGGYCEECLTDEE